MVNYESPNTSTLPVTSRFTSNSIPHTSAAISAQFTVGLASANHRAWACTTYPHGPHTSTPPEPTFCLSEAPPSNCNTHYAAPSAAWSTPTRVSGILSTTSLCTTTGVFTSGRGSCLSNTKVSAYVADHGLSPSTQVTAYCCKPTTYGRNFK